MQKDYERAFGAGDRKGAGQSISICFKRRSENEPVSGAKDDMSQMRRRRKDKI